MLYESKPLEFFAKSSKGFLFSSHCGFGEGVAVVQRVFLGAAIIALSVVAFVPLPMWLTVGLIGIALLGAVGSVFIRPRPPKL